VRIPTLNILALLLAGMLTGCAVPAPNEVLYQCVSFQADKRVGSVKDAGFAYGNAMALYGMTVSSVRAGTFCKSAPVPDIFEVYWKTSDGSIHIANVPVRERLIRRATPRLDLIFVFTPDGIEGYIEDSYTERRLFVEQSAKVVPPLK
jgi:hypothetical protein